MRVMDYISQGRELDGMTFFETRKSELPSIGLADLPAGVSSVRQEIGAFLFHDTEIRSKDYLRDTLNERFSGNLSWMEQSLNGRHGEDYATMTACSEKLEYWLRIAITLENSTSAFNHYPRMYLLSIPKKAGDQFWFSFGVLRDVEDNPFHGGVGNLIRSKLYFQLIVI